MCVRVCVESAYPSSPPRTNSETSAEVTTVVFPTLAMADPGDPEIGETCTVTSLALVKPRPSGLRPLAKKRCRNSWGYNFSKA